MKGGIIFALFKSYVVFRQNFDHVEIIDGATKREKPAGWLVGTTDGSLLGLAD